MPAGNDLEDFQTVTLDGINLRGIKNVSFTVSGATTHVNWFRFYADTYNNIPGQPPVRYDQATNTETPIDTAGTGTYEIFDGFIFLNNRVLDGEAGHTSMRLPRVAGVVNETGGRLQVRYGQTASCEQWDSVENYPGGDDQEISSWATNTNDCFPSYNTNDANQTAPNVFNKWKVRSTYADTIDGNSDVITANETMRTDYFYGEPHYAKTDADEPSSLHEDFRGHDFTIVRQVGENGRRLSQTWTNYFQGTGNNTSEWGIDEDWLVGRPQRSQQYGATGEWVRQEQFSWPTDPYHSDVTAADGGDEARFIGTSRIDVQTRELGATALITTRTENVYDEYGRVTEFKNGGQVFPTLSEDNRSTRTKYVENITDWILSAPCEVQQFDSSNGGTELARTRTSYQGQSSACAGSPTSTRPIDVRNYASASTVSRTRYSYDDFGRVDVIRDPRSKFTTFGYDTTWGPVSYTHLTLPTICSV